MHCGEAQGHHGSLRAPHAAARLSQKSVWTSSAARTGLKAELGGFYGIGLGVLHSVSEWIMTRADKVLYWTAVAYLFRWCRLCGRNLWEEAGSGHEVPVTTY
jgi:hypothetical protein